MLHAQEILNIKKRLNDIYVKHTGQPLKKIEDALERDYFLTAEMAVEWGVVDKVVDAAPGRPARPQGCLIAELARRPAPDSGQKVAIEAEFSSLMNS